MLGDELGKIIIVSDIHYEQSTFHGIDESRTFDWILNLLVELLPTDLISLGDWDMRGQFNIGKKSLPLLKCTQYLGIMMI